MESNPNLTFDDAEKVLEEIGHTIGRLLTVLQVRGQITDEDREFVRGALDQDTWYKQATRSPYDIFMDLLNSADVKKPDMPNDT